jgi:hypothetical protein
MAKDQGSDRSRRDPQPEIGDAELLFRDEGRGPAQPAPKPPLPAWGEVFDLADNLEADVAPAAPSATSPRVPRDPISKKESRKPREPRPEAAAADAGLDPAALVQEVWSRTGEWGPSLILVGGWVGFLAIVLYIALGQGALAVALVALILGGAVAVILAYPILITLERPVRITPEQAVRDYYGALSHHLPQYRRMWLLLSTAGRVSSAFGSFAGFKNYWKDRLASMRQGHAGSLTPLVFDVTEFQADKSAGKARIDAEFKLSVSIRGQRKGGPIQKIPLKIALVRGPDKMWYLENGTLTGADRAAR